MVYHVLANGATTKDITGHIVKMKDAEPLYDLMRKIGKTKKLNTDKEAKVCRVS